MEDKLDVIIKLLTEINNKLTPVGPDSSVKPKSNKPKKLSEKQLLLQEVENIKARDRTRNRERAKNMFAEKQERVNQLEEKLCGFQKPIGNNGKK